METNCNRLTEKSFRKAGLISFSVNFVDSLMEPLQVISLNRPRHQVAQG